MEPQTVEPGLNPVKLTVTAAFPGLILEHGPDSVELRAEAIGNAFPLRARKPVFRLVPDNGPESDLTAPGKAYQFFSSCSGCWADTLVVRMPFSDLQRVAASGALTIEVLGFTVRASNTDLQCLRKFIDTIKDGVTIRWHQAWSF
jgi:hypothetical protein